MSYGREWNKIRHLPHEDELVLTFTRLVDGIYYKTLFFVVSQSFNGRIRIGKELEYGIQSGRIVDAQSPIQVLKNSLEEGTKMQQPLYLRNKTIRILNKFMLYLSLTTRKYLNIR